MTALQLPGLALRVHEALAEGLEADPAAVKPEHLHRLPRLVGAERIAVHARALRRKRMKAS